MKLLMLALALLASPLGGCALGLGATAHAPGGVGVAPGADGPSRSGMAGSLVLLGGLGVHAATAAGEATAALDGGGERSLHVRSRDLGLSIHVPFPVLPEPLESPTSGLDFIPHAVISPVWAHAGVGLTRRRTSAVLVETGAAGEARFDGRVIVADVGAGIVVQDRVLSSVFGTSIWPGLGLLSLRVDVGYGVPLSGRALGGDAGFLSAEPTAAPGGAVVASRDGAARAGLGGAYGRVGLAFGL